MLFISDWLLAPLWINVWKAIIIESSALDASITSDSVTAPTVPVPEIIFTWTSSLVKSFITRSTAAKLPSEPVFKITFISCSLEAFARFTTWDKVVTPAWSYFLFRDISWIIFLAFFSLLTYSIITPNLFFSVKPVLSLGGRR